MKTKIFLVVSDSGDDNDVIEEVAVMTATSISKILGKGYSSISYQMRSDGEFTTTTIGGISPIQLIVLDRDTLSFGVKTEDNGGRTALGIILLRSPLVSESDKSLIRKHIDSQLLEQLLIEYVDYEREIENLF